MEKNTNNDTFALRKYVPFSHQGNTYYFEVLEEKQGAGHHKKIYFGHFTKDADEAHSNPSLPEGVEYNRQYCLKEAQFYLPLAEQSYPQNRHFWDFYPFEGENLRQVVALNDDAKELTEQLRAGTLDLLESGEKTAYNCAVLEPVYKPFNPALFRTYAAKVDAMLQIVAGVKQLMQEQALYNYRIIAHRDLKFDNVMMEELPDNHYKLRLIDFPTVKFEPRVITKNKNYTRMGFLSLSNTAPEDVMEKYAVSAKTDVFALGTMLAEILEIWQYGMTWNPLSLLFSEANGIDFCNVDDCEQFYVRLEERYPYKGTEVPGWLERALDQHDKNAAWGRVERFCPQLRTLFRGATAINPQARMTLDQFESGLMAAGKTLSKITYAEETVEEQISYFLVDTTDLDAYREIYLSGVMSALLKNPQQKIALLPYAGCHAENTLVPSPEAMDPEALPGLDAVNVFRELAQTPAGENDCSALKGCLFDLCGYLGNETVRQDFGGEIHIFAPVTPNEENMNCFKIIEEGVGGAMQDKLLTGAEIAAQLGEGVSITVHTFAEDAAMDEPGWYTVEFFRQTKPAAGPAPVAAETSVSDGRGQKRVKKGAGFHFIGGEQIFE